jgi:hypothetical protein
MRYFRFKIKKKRSMREKNGLNLLNAKVKVHSLRRLSGKELIACESPKEGR